jgi:hypothetical protein
MHHSVQFNNYIGSELTNPLGRNSKLL